MKRILIPYMVSGEPAGNYQSAIDVYNDSDADQIILISTRRSNGSFAIESEEHTVPARQHKVFDWNFLERGIQDGIIAVELVGVDDLYVSPFLWKNGVMCILPLYENIDPALGK